ncbi:membrane protein mix1 [Perkinsela sp. CCAP 1560/4]|nr:membrane protein mix1 [Perkinsela sp. CCAP 1560/4]|eukprot:KNH09577.1 membrane protein mix1 [Perkinsela sp. CCAP 1560/4]
MRVLVRFQMELPYLARHLHDGLRNPTVTTPEQQATTDDSSKEQRWALRIRRAMRNRLATYVARRMEKRADQTPSNLAFEAIHFAAFFFFVMLIVLSQLEATQIRKELSAMKEKEDNQVEILRNLLHGEKQARIPWPLLHRQITQIREGKQSIANIFALYQHVKVFYPNDWLFLIEIGNILTHHNNQSLALRAKIKDPMGFRHEVLQNLLFLKHGRRVSFVENPDLEVDAAPGTRVIEASGERCPRELRGLLDSVIEDVQISTRPSDGFEV